MNILVTGSTGLVGNALGKRLEAEGHRVVPMVRSGTDSAPDSVCWDPAKGALAAEALEGFDAVVHLAGEPIAGGRWTAGRKARIRDSRVDGTQLLCDRLAACANPPKILVAASAIGYYGDRADEVLDEGSSPGSGFLADVCVSWEAATASAASAGIRVVNLRIGLVLSADGGALAKMLPPFKLGLGGTLGGGKPWMSWIHLDDLVGAIRFALDTESMAGAVNGVAPEPVTNQTFTKTLGRALGRPTVLPAPTPLLRLALGEMADALLLCSTRVVPQRLSEAGFEFKHPRLEGALGDLLP